MSPRLVIAAVVLGLAGSCLGQQPAKSAQRAPARVPHKAPDSGAANQPAQPEAAQPAPSAPGATAISVQRVTPAALADSYLMLLSANQPYAAVDECFDIHSFMQRVFGEELGRMDASRVAYIEQLASVSIKATLAGGRMDRVLKTTTRSPFGITQDSDGTRVSFTLTATKKAGRIEGHSEPHPVHLLLRQGEAGWRIVDIEPIASNWKKLYEADKSAGHDCIEFMEMVAQAIVEHKRDPTALDSKTREAQAAYIQVALDTLNNQCELFRARTSRYPNFAADGWKEMIDGGYLKSAPVNPLNASSEISTRKDGKVGWYWNEKSGTITAYGFDEQTGRVTVAGVPATATRPIDKYKEYAAAAKASSCKATLGGVRAAIANFYANAAVDGKAVYPTLEQLQKAGIVLEEAIGPNPYNGNATIAPGKWDPKHPASGSSGWNYDAANGRFWANTSDVGENDW